MKNRLYLVALCCPLGMIFHGCSHTASSPIQNIDPPSEWHSNTTDFIEECPVDQFVWWESLNDPVLDSLMERASSYNIDLYIAATRILEARLERKGEEAELLPRLDASATYAHAQYNRNSLNKILGLSSCNKKSGTKNVDLFEVGFDAEWELDLFGATAHEIKALTEDLQAKEAEFCQVWITLSAEVARNYIELRGLQHRLQVLEQHVESQMETIQLIEDLLATGFVTDLDHMQANEQINLLFAQRPQIQFAIEKAIHRLSILLGHNPGDLYCELSVCAPLPILPNDKPIGYPSELLRRRPDIRKAEKDVAASCERIEGAIAALFPRFSLTGFIGEIGANLTKGNGVWFLSPQLLAPIFNSRLLKQDVEFNKIKAQQALYQYQKTVLEALEEAENAIAAFHYENERMSALQTAQQSTSQAHQTTSELYHSGFKSYLEVLVAERSLLATEEALLQSHVDLLLDYVALYKALGGASI